ncbi:MAG TPA: hypothetical protein VHT03_01640 [Rhizomicrobium sp.]|jgi:hypothetical protein|nr:hypothetical protein [Rhizomicrobium sp.]
MFGKHREALDLRAWPIQPAPETFNPEPLYSDVKAYAARHKVSRDLAYRTLRKQMLLDAVPCCPSLRGDPLLAAILCETIKALP